ncbi:DUF5060 domain-containing protein [Singulisphaera rosea]
MRGALTSFILIGSLFVQTPRVASAAEPLIEGTLKAWHPMSLSFQGPEAGEGDDAPNPFLDCRLQVSFSGPEGRVYDVPGFFDVDGRGGHRGVVWRVRFTPDRPGHWRYRATFRVGSKVALERSPDAGKPASIDGTSGEFHVDDVDPEAPGVWKWGRLAYSGTFYLKFADGPYWIKGGTDEPENFLAYRGFDDTVPSHAYEAHVDDWRPGDPDWGGGKGKAIIGALNYLSSRHVNSIYFLTMNVGGDGKDVWPWARAPERKGSPGDDNLHFDVSKLAQWNLVFEHAQRLGIVLHVVFNEAERANKRELDDGELGVERTLYYREMIARFGHHPALQWNLCEEYNLAFDLGAERVSAFAKKIRELDPYDHPITVHSAGDPIKALRFTFGNPDFDATSIQLGHRRIDELTEAFRKETAASGRPLPVFMDEFTVDTGKNRPAQPVDDIDALRKQKLWPTYLSGGSIEFILEALLDVDNFKTPPLQRLWDETWFARRFIEALPFWEMTPDDGLVRGASTLEVGVGKGKSATLGAQVFAKTGYVYAVYLPKSLASGEINLSGVEGRFSLRWYNPRTGEFQGERTVVNAGGWVPLGVPPGGPDVEDWAILLERDQTPKATSSATSGAERAQHFPGKGWETRDPASLGLDPATLDALANSLGGQGCIVKDGYVVKTWGSQAEKRDWFSSAKPVLSTLLMFAMREGKVKSPDQPIAEFGWALKPKDQGMTFRHLASMTSGYARPEKPGEAWSYNDFAIQLYQKTLFDRVFQGDPEAVANHATRFGAIGLEDGLSFRKSNRRISASVRDFARIAWFWLNGGEWEGKTILPREYFEENMRPQVPKTLPSTRPAETDDYLGIGTYGGGSDHFAKCGRGTYGFNWWFNATGRDHPNLRTWPDAPEELIMSVGARGNCSAILPSRNAIVVAADANWGSLEGGKVHSRLNHNLELFAKAVTPEAK